MGVTIIDVAKEVGKSYQTVSRALNNHPKISEKTRRMIHDAANRLGYSPNLLARSMVEKKSVPVVGIMLTQPSGKIPNDDYLRYFSMTLPALTSRLNHYELEALFIPFIDEEQQIRRLKKLYTQGLLGGVISGILPNSNREFCAYLEESGIPHMILGHPECGNLHCAYASINHVDILSEYIRKKDFKRIYHVTRHNDGTLMFSRYPFRYNYHWLAPDSEVDAGELNSKEAFFVLMGNSIWKFSYAEMRSRTIETLKRTGQWQPWTEEDEDKLNFSPDGQSNKAPEMPFSFSAHTKEVQKYTNEMAKNDNLIKNHMAMYYEKTQDGSYWDKNIDLTIRTAEIRGGHANTVGLR
jgi:hypothetical protein